MPAKRKKSGKMVCPSVVELGREIGAVMIHTIYISRDFTFGIVSARPESRPAGRCKRDVSATFSEVVQIGRARDTNAPIADYFVDQSLTFPI